VPDSVQPEPNGPLPPQLLNRLDLHRGADERTHGVLHLPRVDAGPSGPRP